MKPLKISIDILDYSIQKKNHRFFVREYEYKIKKSGAGNYLVTIYERGSNNLVFDVYFSPEGVLDTRFFTKLINERELEIILKSIQGN